MAFTMMLLALQSVVLQRMSDLDAFEKRVAQMFDASEGYLERIQRGVHDQEDRDQDWGFVSVRKKRLIQSLHMLLIRVTRKKHERASLRM